MVFVFYTKKFCVLCAKQQLLKLKNSHMKKLERDKGGAKVYYEKEVGKIMGKFDDFPKRLSLEQQGQFALGYYHQQQEKYKKGEDK